MVTPRELLEVLGKATLVRLINARGLPRSRRNAQRRATLARSYRGDVEALIHELQRGELVRVFRRIWFPIGGERMELRNPSKYRLEDLVPLALRAFAGRRVRVVAEFTPYVDDEHEEDWEDEEDEEEEDEEEEEEDDEEEDDEEEDDEEEDDVVDSEDEDDTPRLLSTLSGDWSRPLMLSRILRGVGMDVPERLRASRFQELLAELSRHGIEACLAVDEERRVLDTDAESPGIASKLRLRRAGGQCDPGAGAGGVGRSPTEKVARLGVDLSDGKLVWIKGQVVWASGPGGGRSVKLATLPHPLDYERYVYFFDREGDLARRARGARSSSPKKKSKKEPRPPVGDHDRDVEVIVDPGEDRIKNRGPRPPDYSLALFQLQFLTAVPSVQRRTMPEWPDAFLEAATRGLTLRAPELGLLRTYAASLCFGNHNPYDSIPTLSQTLSPAEWRALLSDFVALNPHHPEFVQAIIEQVQPVEADVPDAHVWRDAMRDAAKREPTRDESTAATDDHGEERANVRDLGVLSGMFEEED